MRFKWLFWKRSRWLVCFLWLFVSLVMVGIGSARSLNTSAEESKSVELNPSEFEAVCLSRIPAYVHWPKKNMPPPEGAFTIGLLETDPFNGLLQKLIEGKTVQGRRLAVKIFKEGDEINSIHLIFIPNASLTLWKTISKDKDLKGIVTVGEDESFTKSGGIFRLVSEQRKVVINQKNAAKAGLEINSKLLRISTVEK